MSVTRTLFSIITATCLCAPATAQDTRHDWGGIYAGLSLEHRGGSLFNQAPPLNFGHHDLARDGSIGIFAGYNWQNGPLVLGTELSHSPQGQEILDTMPVAAITSTTSLKARIGYATGQWLFYGSAGGTWSDFDHPIAHVVTGHRGTTVGLGVDYAIRDNFIVGAAYERHNTESENSFAFPAQDIERDIFQLRLGYQF